jgi:hypothetical protein
MKCISKNCKLNINKKVFESAEEQYSISIRTDIKEFLENNSGGYPEKDIIVSDGDEYEVRVFMSLDASDENYYIQKPLDYFLRQTKGKIVPIGIDSGDNYYCVNNETGKVYYWSAGEDSYYCVAETMDDFIKLFE